MRKTMAPTREAMRGVENLWVLLGVLLAWGEFVAVEIGRVEMLVVREVMKVVGGGVLREELDASNVLVVTPVLGVLVARIDVNKLGGIGTSLRDDVCPDITLQLHPPAKAHGTLGTIDGELDLPASDRSVVCDGASSVTA